MTTPYIILIKLLEGLKVMQRWFKKCQFFDREWLGKCSKKVSRVQSIDDAVSGVGLNKQLNLM